MSICSALAFIYTCCFCFSSSFDPFLRFYLFPAPSFPFSLAGKFEIEWGQADREGLEQADREWNVHIKIVFAYAPKLHVDVVVVVLVYQLEVLDARLVYAPVEIQNERLHLFVPFGRLIEEKHDLLHVVLLELLLNRVVGVLRVPNFLHRLIGHIW